MKHYPISSKHILPLANSGQSPLSNITLIIPSYNRQAYLKRQLKFWRDSDVSIIILDGSKQSMLSTFASANKIRYIHMPESIENRLGFAAKIIHTKYAAMLSDDELFIPSALEACIAFLENNVDYSACKGQVVGFRRNRFIKRCQGVIEYSNLRGYEITSSSAEERLMEHMSPYAMASLWAVHRTEVLSKALTLASLRPPYSSAAVFEVQLSLSTAWLGKIKVLDQLMWLRSRENKNIWWASGNVSTIDWMSKKSYKAEVSQFINDFSEFYSDDKLGYNNIMNCVTRAFFKYKSNGIATRRKKPLGLYIYSKVTSALWGLVGERFRVVFRRIMKIDHSLMDVAFELSKSGIVVDFRELNRIDSFLINFNLEDDV